MCGNQVFIERRTLRRLGDGLVGTKRFRSSVQDRKSPPLMLDRLADNVVIFMGFRELRVAPDARP